jgi:hypothetical protein
MAANLENRSSCIRRVNPPPGLVRQACGGPCQAVHVEVSAFRGPFVPNLPRATSKGRSDPAARFAWLQIQIAYLEWTEYRDKSEIDPMVPDVYTVNNWNYQALTYPNPRLVGPLFFSVNTVYTSRPLPRDRGQSGLRFADSPTKTDAHRAFPRMAGRGDDIRSLTASPLQAAIRARNGAPRGRESGD